MDALLAATAAEKDVVDGGETIFQGKRDRADNNGDVSAASVSGSTFNQPRASVVKKNKLSISIMQGTAPYRQPRVGNEFQCVIPPLGEVLARVVAPCKNNNN